MGTQLNYGLLLGPAHKLGERNRSIFFLSRARPSRLSKHSGAKAQGGQTGLAKCSPRISVEGFEDAGSWLHTPWLEKIFLGLGNVTHDFFTIS